MKAYIAKDLIKVKTRRITKRRVLAWVSGFIALVCLFALVTHNWHILAIPFDPGRMWVETGFTATLRTYDDEGNPTGTSWRAIDTHNWAQEGEVRHTELFLRTQGFSGNLHMYGRTIYRNGEAVRLVFYNYTESLLGWFLRIAFNRDNRATGTSGGLALSAQQEGADFYAEVYYLPNLHRLLPNRHGNLAMLDNELDALRKNAAPVWRGVVEQP
ncbi:MAG: hypothetical protein FWC16_13630 [Defluviitaleaceae bacterium]|nr:hypothetical protein [Defluviitaleaceae bacterium]MCL2275959.1 hypothetical protein [Defluviitaleaceae bacterium]